MEELLRDLKRREGEAKLGGGKTAIEREKGKGKLKARERLDLLFDPDTFFEVGLFAKHRCHDFDLESKMLQFILKKAARAFLFS